MVEKKFFGHMIPSERIRPGGELAQPVTVFIGLLRLWDSLAVWKYMAREGTGGIIRVNGEDQYQPDASPATALEDNLAYAERVGAEVMFTFGRPPIFSCISGSETVPTLAAWEGFVKQVVTQAGGRVKYWELWNEPELAMYWSGSRAQLVTYARLAYATIKLLQPDAIVLSPSMTELNEQRGVEFAEGYFAAGGGAWCDAIAFHHYQAEPEMVLADLKTLTAVLKKYNLLHLPIFCTEFNYVPRDVALRNAYIAQFMVILASLGVQGVVYDPETEPPLTIIPMTLCNALPIGC